jgi:hypothetical protein
MGSADCSAPGEPALMFEVDGHQLFERGTAEDWIGTSSRGPRVSGMWRGLVCACRAFGPLEQAGRAWGAIWVTPPIDEAAREAGSTGRRREDGLRSGLGHEGRPIGFSDGAPVSHSQTGARVKA